MTSDTLKLKKIPAQKQAKQPGREYKMNPRPEYIRKGYKGSGKLKGKIAVITGGDSGIGRAVAVHFAREGANLVIVYYDENRDARETQALVEKEGRKCLLIKGDLKKADFCRNVIKQTIKTFRKLDILINNAGEQFEAKDLKEVSDEQLQDTFETNIFSMFYLTKAALEEMKEGAAIVNTTSITAYRGSSRLMDYAATKGAILAFTRSLAANLAEKGIRVNGVAPGPVWTPLIPSSFSAKEVAEFGAKQPMKRAGQPSEIAPSFVFLACEDASYITGQVLHPNGGEPVGS